MKAVTGIALGQHIDNSDVRRAIDIDAVVAIVDVVTAYDDDRFNVVDFLSSLGQVDSISAAC